MARSERRGRRGSVSIEMVALLAVVLPFAFGLLALALRSFVVVERFMVEALRGPTP